MFTYLIKANIAADSDPDEPYPLGENIHHQVAANTTADAIGIVNEYYTAKGYVIYGIFALKEGRPLSQLDISDTGQLELF